MAKKKIICDTDVIIDYLDARQKRFAKTSHVLEDQIGLENIVISVVTKMELVKGANNKVDLAKTIKNVSGLPTVLISDEISVVAYGLVEKYSLSHNISMPDSFIAATAIITGFELFTYNIKDYRFIKEVKLFMPLD